MRLLEPKALRPDMADLAIPVALHDPQRGAGVRVDRAVVQEAPRAHDWMPRSSALQAAMPQVSASVLERATRLCVRAFHATAAPAR